MAVVSGGCNGHSRWVWATVKIRWWSDHCHARGYQVRQRERHYCSWGLKHDSYWIISNSKGCPLLFIMFTWWLEEAHTSAAIIKLRSRYQDMGEQPTCLKARKPFSWSTSDVPWKGDKAYNFTMTINWRSLASHWGPHSSQQNFQHLESFPNRQILPTYATIKYYHWQ